MADVYVDHPVYSLGDDKTNVAESEAAGRLSSAATDLISAGFEWHHLCGPATTPYDLAKAAVAQLPDEALANGGTDAIVYATCLPSNGNVGDVEKWRETRDVSHLMEFPGSQLQDDFSLERAVVVGLNQQGCTSMLGAIRVGAALLSSEPDWERVLCVVADRFPEGAIYEQAYNLVSDGAAACVVTKKPGRFRLLTTHQITNGGLSNATHDERVGTYFSYLNPLISETLRRAELDIDDISWIVPQNTNRKAWQIMARLLGVDLARVWQPTVRDVGHAISADNIINLAALAESPRLLPGQRVLLLMVGHGLNLQAVLLEATEATATDKAGEASGDVGRACYSSGHGAISTVVP